MPRQGVRAPRATAAFIALHARRRPGHVAVICDDRETTYAVLNRDVHAMTAALSLLTLPSNAVVAVEHPSLYPRLLVTLAFERLGVLVAPFRADEAGELLAVADLIMSGSVRDAASLANHLPITDEWLSAVLSQASTSCQFPPPLPRDPVLMLRTSGSTGRKKQVVVTRAMLAARLGQRVASQDFHRDDRFLALSHFGVSTTFYAVLLCLRLGATVMAHRNLPVSELLERYRPTKTCMMPFQLGTLLEQRGGLPRVPRFQCIVTGGRVTTALRSMAIERLCERVIENYGASEAGAICEIDEDGLGRLLPGVAVEVVGEDGEPVAADAVGEIRVRGDTVFDGYVGDPAATAATVRDGWWHTGDFARAMPDGRIRLLGRRDDILNFGGIKRTTGDVETAIRALVGCDVAVLAQSDLDGRTVAAACIAATHAAAAADLAVRLESEMPGRFAVYCVEAIPRTPEGKLQRAVLSRAIAGLRPLPPHRPAVSVCASSNVERRSGELAGVHT